MQKLILGIKDRKVDLSSLGFCIKERPHIPTPEQDIESVEVQGRDGALHIEKGYRDIDISVELNFLEDKLHDSIRKVKDLLFDCDKIIFSDDDGFCYLVNYIKIGDIENEVSFYGSFEVVFNCRPYSYKLSTFKYIQVANSIVVEGYKALPLFKITKNSNEMQFTIDGNMIKVDSTANVVYIDCDNLTCYSESINLLDEMSGEFPVLTTGQHTISNKRGILNIEVMLREGWR